MKSAKITSLASPFVSRALIGPVWNLSTNGKRAWIICHAQLCKTNKNQSQSRQLPVDFHLFPPLFPRPHSLTHDLPSEIRGEREAATRAQRERQGTWR